MPQQKALLLSASNTKFVVGTNDIPKPKPGEVLVKVQSTALNPVEWKIQRGISPVVPAFPAVLGSDAAGIVEEVGECVIRFQKGDRIVHQGYFTNDKATFQQYLVVPAEIAAKIPANVSFDEAVSIPLGLATAAVGLYGSPLNHNAGLTPPWDGGLGAYEDNPIMIFSGPSSIGQYAIQLAKLSGFSPIMTTASPHNADYLKALGATHVIDRKASILEEARKITLHPISLVYDAISSEETQAVAWDLTAEDGSLVLVLSAKVDKEKYPTKKLLWVVGNVHVPQNRALGVALYTVLEEWLKNGLIKPNRVKALPDGLQGIIAGLDRLENEMVSGVKLVAHPQETA